jgi:cell volume regulation protein A
VAILSKTRLPGGGLYPVATIAIAALAYGAADTLHGSGCIAVYLAGVCLGGAFIPAKRSITNFHDGLAWVAQIGMFFLLGLLVLPSQLTEIGWQSLLLALVLIFIARPLAVMISTAWHPFDWRDRVTLSWAGLRGATPVVLATFPVVAGVPGSAEFFQIVFFAVLASVLLQGASFEPLARRLGVTSNLPALPKLLTETGVIQGLGGEVVEYEVGAEDAIVGGRVRDLGLPREAVVIVIVRGEQAIPPRGSTKLEAGDHLHFLVRQEVAKKIPRLIEEWEIGVMPKVSLNRGLRARAGIFTMRPWNEEDGDPEKPRTIGGIRVFDYLRTRHDRPGALVQTVDGRYALTGVTLAFGGRRAVQAYAIRHIKQSGDEAERMWWREVIGALSDEQGGDAIS